MNAEEAKSITKKSIKQKVDDHLLKHVFEKIKHDAEQGRSETAHPLSGLNGLKYPSSDEQYLLWAELIKLGFRVNHHDDPDPGDPRSSGGYTTINW